MGEDTQQPDPKLLKDIDMMSVEDLHARIAELHLEIKMCEAAIARKGDAKSTADAMFSLGKKD